MLFRLISTTEECFACHLFRRQIPESSTQLFLKTIAATALTSAMAISSVVASSQVAALGVFTITELTGGIAVKLALAATMAAVTVPTCIAISFLISKIAIKIIEQSGTAYEAHISAITASVFGTAIALPMTGSLLMSIPIGTFIGGLAGGIYLNYSSVI